MYMNMYMYIYIMGMDLENATERVEGFGGLVIFVIGWCPFGRYPCGSLD